MNYYNEFDHKAAAALRALISDGLIPYGDVDDRSITEVRASELAGYTQCHFFAGIGGWSYALELAGWEPTRPVWTGSCPCQPFSTAGKGTGKADERHLWPVWFSLIREGRPAVVFGEQVAAAITHGWLDEVATDLEAESYAIGSAIVPACGVGAPHRRDRLWFVADTNRWGNIPSNSRADFGTIPGGHEKGNAGGKSGPLANATSEREHSGQRGSRENEIRDLKLAVSEPGSDPKHSSGSAGELANPESIGCRERDLYPAGRGDGSGPRQGGWTSSRGDINAEPLDDAQSQGIGREVRDLCETDGGQGGTLPQQPHSGGERPAGIVGHACGARGSSGLPAQARGSQGDADVIDDRSGGRLGPWSECEWLPGRDGKQRPVKPGIRLLAHGFPERVGLLRAAGNAIVPQAGEEIIIAYKAIRGIT